MTNIALDKPLDQTQLKRLAHGGGALIVTVLLLLILTLAGDAMIGPKLELLASLQLRAQSIEALEAALETQQEALGQNLQIIGGKAHDGPASLSSVQILETLENDADALIGELEAFGFLLNNRSEPNKRAITPALAVSSIKLGFTGDNNAAAALMSAPVASSADIKNLSLTSDGQQSVTLSLTMQRIGASAMPENGDADE